MNRRQLARACVGDGERLKDAARALEEGGFEIALITDPVGRLVGTLTDGDLRRALLRGASLESPLRPHMNREFTAVSTHVGRTYVLDLMRARTIAQIPVVDADNRVVGLHLLREFVGNVQRDNWAVIMAGGKGSRLWPLTESIPKPMLRVAGRPILERLILHLAGFGIRKIFVAINHLGHIIESYFGDGAHLGTSIEYLRERDPLGTGGALALLPQRPDRALLVLNGDLVTQTDMGTMLEFHERNSYAMTVGVRPYCHTVPFGRVAVEDGRIVEYSEKPQLVLTVNAGLYVLSPALLCRVPAGRPFALPELIDDCLGKGEPVGAFEVRDDWIDVGEMDMLRRAREGSG
jgi:dTDP-glucose pyrophosphorylase